MVPFTPVSQTTPMALIFRFFFSFGPRKYTAIQSFLTIGMVVILAMPFLVISGGSHQTSAEATIYQWTIALRTKSLQRSALRNSNPGKLAKGRMPD